MAGYRDRLHGWAAGYAARRWPADTPQYLLRDYARMLAMTGNVARLSELAADAARHERMLELTGGDALALDETAAAQAAVLARQPPDLVAAAVLALRRAELTRRNTVVPVGLAAVWAALGDTPRAEALAGGAAGAARRGAALADAAQAAASIGHLVDAEALLDAITDGARRERAVAAVVAEAARIDLAHAARLTSRLAAGPLRDSADLVVAAAWAAGGPARATDALAGLEERWAGRARRSWRWRWPGPATPRRRRRCSPAPAAAACRRPRWPGSRPRWPPPGPGPPRSGWPRASAARWSAPGRTPM